MNFMARPRISNINVRLRLDEAWQNEDGGCFETGTVPNFHEKLHAHGRDQEKS